MYWIERKQGTGVVANISSSGALLEDASFLLHPGTKVRLNALVAPEKKVELFGVVIRQVPTGFAVEFAPSSSGAARQLVDEILAISPSQGLESR